MTAVQKNLIVQQGETWTNSVPLVDVNGDAYPTDNTSWVANGTIRREYTSNTNTAILMVTAVITGNVVLTMDANTTALLTAPFRYVYDVNLTDPTGIVVRLQEGLLTVTPGVSY